MRLRILFVLLACCLASASLSYAGPPPQKCVPPPPNKGLTPIQQKLDADSYRLACESANAYEATKHNDSGAEVDEAGIDLPMPLAEYKRWLRDTCPNLNSGALTIMRGMPEDQQLYFLRGLHFRITVTNAGHCL